MPLASKKWILIIDENPTVGNALKHFLEAETDFAVLVVDRPGATLLETIRTVHPALLIMDLKYEKVEGMTLLGDLRAADPGLLILVCAMSNAFPVVEQVLEQGARGYIHKTEAAIHLVLAIQRVLAGEIFLSERIQVRRQKKTTGF